MRRNLLHAGATELVYEIREIVKKAHLFQNAGVEIFWENIGDPVQKGTPIPDWMKNIVAGLAQDSRSYGYCPIPRRAHQCLGRGASHTGRFPVLQRRR